MEKNNCEKSMNYWHYRSNKHTSINNNKNDLPDNIRSSAGIVLPSKKTSITSLISTAGSQLANEIRCGQMSIYLKSDSVSATQTISC